MSDGLAQAPFAAVGGVMLHAQRRGELNAPVIVFSNSLGTDARIWQAVLALLPAHYGVMLYDKRGHGLSDAPRGPYSLDDHARELLGLLDHFGIDRFALVGLSVGGMIAQTVAAQNPGRVAALVLCDTAAKIGEAEAWDRRIDAVEHEGLESIADGVMERWFTPSYRTEHPIALRGWRTMLARQPAGGYAATCASIRDADLRSQAETIRTPTLLLVGDQDISTPPALVRGTADLIPGATLEIIAGAGHIPCVEKPEAVAVAIARHCAESGF